MYTLQSSLALTSGKAPLSSRERQNEGTRKLENVIGLTVSIVRGGCGVMGGWSSVGIITPVIGGIADDTGDSCAPRGRLQRGPGGLVPPSRARLAAHVHPAEIVPSCH